MQAARVVGVRRERSLAAKLRVEIFSGPQMAKASLAKHRRIVGAGRSRLRRLGRCPAFTTVHLHDSSRGWINL